MNTTGNCTAAEQAAKKEEKEERELVLYQNLFYFLTQNKT